MKKGSELAPTKTQKEIQHWAECFAAEKKGENAAMSTNKEQNIQRILLTSLSLFSPVDVWEIVIGVRYFFARGGGKGRASSRLVCFSFAPEGTPLPFPAKMQFCLSFSFF